MAENGSKTITDALRYDAWGELIASTTSALPTPWRYQGRLDVGPDASNPLYDFGARDYRPVTGAFTSLDSYAGQAIDPLSMNRFLYAEGNPSSFVDPDGHCARYEDSVCADHQNSAAQQQAAAAQHQKDVAAAQRKKNVADDRIETAYIKRNVGGANKVCDASCWHAIALAFGDQAGPIPSTYSGDVIGPQSSFSADDLLVPDVTCNFGGCVVSPFSKRLGDFACHFECQKQGLELTIDTLTAISFASGVGALGIATRALAAAEISIEAASVGARLGLASATTGGIATAHDCLSGHTAACAIGLASAAFGVSGSVLGAAAAGLGDDVRRAVEWVTDVGAKGFDTGGLFQMLTRGDR